MSRLSGRLVILMILTTLLALGFSGCESFTLIGSVNLGPGGMQGPEDQDADGQNDEEADAVCWPAASDAFSEMRRHGFTPRGWPATELWFTKLEPVKNSLPPCPAE